MIATVSRRRTRFRMTGGGEVPAKRVDLARFMLFAALLLVAALAGGSSRNDVVALILLQPVAVLLAIAGLLIDPRAGTAPRVSLVLLGLVAAIMMFQLIPLPPTFWTLLPGRGPIADAAAAAGIAQPWRPISLSPDLTLASLVGLVVPAAAVVLFDPSGSRWSNLTIWALLALALASATLGAAQVAGGADSSFYLYRITNRASSVGIFANRNHQAMFLAMTYPILAAWVVMQERGGAGAVPRLMALGCGVLLLPLIALTGSRAGALLAVVGIAFAILQLRVSRWQGPRLRDRLRESRVALAVVVLALLAGLAVLAMLLTRTEAVVRLASMDAGDDPRLRALPIVLRIIVDHLPFGTGFGVFDPVYRAYEPVSGLTPRYLNHAHSDALELLVNTGLLGAALIVAGAWWFVPRALAAFAGPSPHERDPMAQLGVAMLAILLLGSLADYPLRTPFLAVVLVVALGWVARAGRERVYASQDRR